MTKIAKELVDVIVDRAEVERSQAIQAVRAIFRHIGGISFYISAERAFGSTVKPVLVSVLGKAGANRTLDALEKHLAGEMIYFPVEINAFRDEIADEIYEQYDGSKQSMVAICHQRNISSSIVYRMYKHAQKNHIQRK